MIKKVFLILISVLLCSGVAAADSNPFRFELISESRKSGSFIESGYPKNSEIEVKIEGIYAQTRFRFEIENMSRFRNEGFIQFHLPTNSVITALKLDIQNQLVSGVNVNKSLAFAAYSSETRRRVDPALLQRIGPDRYELRVYPINPGKSRTLEIQWIQLLEADENGRLKYTFPFDWDNEKKISFIEITALSDSDLKIESKPANMGQFKVSRERFITVSLKNQSCSMNTPLTFSIASDRIDRKLIVQEQGGYFYASSVVGASQKDLEYGKPLSIIWDASLSRERQDHQKEIRLIKQLTDEIETPMIYLTLFRNKLEETLVFKRDIFGTYGGLFEYLSGITYDGFSDAALLSSNIQVEGFQDPEFHLLITGDLEYAPLGNNDFSVPIYPVALLPSSASYSAETIQAIAAKSGGIWLRYQAPLDDFYKRIRLVILSTLKHFNLRGWQAVNLGKDRASIFRRLSKDELEKTKSSYTTLKLLDQFYLLVEAGNINRYAYFNQSNDIAGKDDQSDYSVVTRFSSLLVLETPEQYARWKIEPPEDVPWERSKYYELVKLDNSDDWRKSNMIIIKNDMEKLNAFFEDESVQPEIQYDEYEKFDIAMKMDDLPNKSFISPYFGGCFPSGTKVLTTSGPKPIECIVIGDSVRTYIPEIASFGVREVMETFIHAFTGELISIDLETEMLEVSDNHPILVLSGNQLESRLSSYEVSTSEQNRLTAGRWIAAGDLEEGDTLLLADGSRTDIRRIVRADVKDLQVFNFTVNDSHTYTVGVSGLVVHNKGAAEEPVSDADYGTEKNTVNSSMVISLSSSQPYELLFDPKIKELVKSIKYIKAQSAYVRYLELRKQYYNSLDLYFLIAELFYSHGETDIGDLIFSNVRELPLGYPDVLLIAFYYEIYNQPEEAARSLISYSHRNKLSKRMLSELADLGMLIEDEDVKRQIVDILEAEIPELFRLRIYSDKSKQDSIGSPASGFIIDYLNINDGNMGMMPDWKIEGKNYRFDLVVKMNCSFGLETISLLIIEPSGEAIFFDNIISDSKGVYWTDFDYLKGIDQFVVKKRPPEGEYKVYILKNEYTWTQDISKDNKLRISITTDYGGDSEKTYVHFTDTPKKPGIYPIAAINADEVLLIE